MAISTETIRTTLRDVMDPELGDNIVDLGMVRKISIVESSVTVEVALTIAGCPLRTQLTKDIKTRVGLLDGVESVQVEMGVMSSEQRSDLMSRARWKARENPIPTQIPDSTRILAVSSGKGGVGKSSVTVNLAVALALEGLSVGLLDADIAGFSTPRMLGMTDRLDAKGGKIQPARKQFGGGTLEVVSMGLIEGSGEDEAVMLRGLMLNRALQHFLEDVAWGKLDYLLIDMPPGTGDVQMGLARMLPRTDLLVVTTPALAAQQVAARAVDMARRGHLRIAGIIENMSAFVCDHGTSYSLFGEGGGLRLSSTTGAPLLASVPLDPAVVSGSDNGSPAVLGTSASADIFKDLANQITQSVAPHVDMQGCTGRLLAAAEVALGPKPGA